MHFAFIGCWTEVGVSETFYRQGIATSEDTAHKSGGLGFRCKQHLKSSRNVDCTAVQLTSLAWFFYCEVANQMIIGPKQKHKTSSEPGAEWIVRPLTSMTCCVWAYFGLVSVSMSS